MSAAEILKTLQGLGVKVVPLGPDRLRLEPASSIPPALISNIRAAKAEILEVLQAKDDPPPSEPCRACGSRLFWRSIHGPVICWRCHPPGSERLIRDILWLEKLYGQWTAEVKWRQ